MKNEIHEEVALKIGNSAYVRVGRGNEGKTFLVLPAKYKELVHAFLQDLEESNAPKLKDVLTKDEISAIRKTIAPILLKPSGGFVGGMLKHNLKELYADLETLDDSTSISNLSFYVKDKKVRAKIRRAYLQ